MSNRTRSSLGPGSDLTVSDLFPIQQSPSYRDNQLLAFQTQNIHEAAQAVVGSGDAPPAEAEAIEPWSHGAGHGMLQHHVEMLVVIMKDDAAWRELQRSTRSCSTMRIRHELDAILKRHFQIAVERGERNKRTQFYRDMVIESYGMEEQKNDQIKSFPMVDEDVSEAATVSTERSSFDDDGDGDGDSLTWEREPPAACDDDGEDGEFLMGGRKGQGMLLEPISYKDIDLLRHPRSQIWGDSQSVVDVSMSRDLKDAAYTPVAVPSRRRSSLSPPCLTATKRTPPRVERV